MNERVRGRLRLCVLILSVAKKSLIEDSEKEAEYRCLEFRPGSAVEMVPESPVLKGEDSNRKLVHIANIEDQERAA